MVLTAGWRSAIVFCLISRSSGSSRDSEIGVPNINDGLHVAVQKVVHQQRISQPTVTVKSAVIVSCPKITDGPSLVRRKLGSIKWDVIHNGIQGQKRDMTSCPPAFNLCPKSMKGGCCPQDRECGTSSCFPKSATSASACGRSGYIACGIPEGGGCCPGGYQCATGGCIPVAGNSEMRTCSANYYLCPASLNFGCCKLGSGCAVSGCWVTSISTFTYTNTLTTTDANLKPHTLTTTVIATTILNAPDPTETVSTGVVGKISPPQTAVAKVEATGTKDSGLTKPQIGGIIGGAIAILSVLIIAALIIIKLLKKAILTSEQASSNTRSLSSGQRPRRPVPRKQDVDEMSVDPLIMTASQTSGSIRQPSSSQNPSSLTYIPRIELEDNSAASPPPSNTNSSSPRSPPPTHHQRNYKPVSSSVSQYSTSSGGHQNSSLDSTTLMQHNPNAGYFDPFATSQTYTQTQSQTQLPSQIQTENNHRLSQVSQMSPQRPNHSRNFSDTTSISQTSSSAAFAELDSQADGERQVPIISSAFTRALHTFRGSMMRGKKSDSVPSSPRSTGGFSGSFSGGLRSPDDLPSPREGLLNIPEAGESRVALGKDQVKEAPLNVNEGTFGAESVRGGTADGETLGNGTFGVGKRKVGGLEGIIERGRGGEGDTKGSQRVFYGGTDFEIMR